MLLAYSLTFSATILVIVVYFVVPILFINWIIPRFDAAAQSRSKIGFFDIILIFLIWLPVEFEFVPTRWITIVDLAWPLGVFLIVFYVLLLLTGWRKLEFFCPGNLSFVTLFDVVIIFFILALIIVPWGMEIGFICPAFNTTLYGKPVSIIFVFLGIFFGVAIPEELLFRGWIQNLLMTHFKFLPGLALSALIFGLSHVDDKIITMTKVFETPNWWYGLFGTIAGLGYGYVYLKRKSLFASAFLHALVDFSWVLFFAG